MSASETIFALASAKGRAGISVFRLSGSLAIPCLCTLIQGNVPPFRRASLRELKNQSGVLIDKGLVLAFKAPASFTGEDMVELHVHGGLAVTAALTAELCNLGLRVAEPGEFTKRAFYNGKLDFTEAEATADLINAETEQQRLLALRQLAGGLRNLYEDWRSQLVRLLAHAEASIDFSDEELPDGLIPSLIKPAADLLAELKAHLNDNHRGEIIRDGYTVVILGAPNVGKSSLLNALIDREAAIVTAVPGTTRDPIEVQLDLGGYAVTLIDTAGLRDTNDIVEREGIRRAKQKAQTANLRLLIVEAIDDNDDSRVSPDLSLGDAIVVSKCDLRKESISFPSGLTKTRFAVSSKTGQGIQELLTWLEQQVIENASVTSAMPLTRARHRHCIEAAVKALSRAVDALSADTAPIDLVAEDLRIALSALGRITGRVDVEELLGAIFKDFCIGK